MSASESQLDLSNGIWLMICRGSFVPLADWWMSCRSIECHIGVVWLGLHYLPGTHTTFNAFLPRSWWRWVYKKYTLVNHYSCPYRSATHKYEYFENSGDEINRFVCFRSIPSKVLLNFSSRIWISHRMNRHFDGCVYYHFNCINIS